MNVFISGTDTNIGKTIVCSWLCLHTGYGYFKPIQTGTLEGSDSEVVYNLSKAKIYPEAYSFKKPLSPHLAAMLENRVIDIENITIPESKNLILEGAGGLMVPLNKNHMMIDLIEFIKIPVIVVASSRLGTINHTLLSLAALRHRGIEILGVIMNGGLNKESQDAIEFYGKTEVLAQIPFINKLSRNSLLQIKIEEKLKSKLEDKI